VGTYKYKAFISYSHKDRAWARWLHRKLETYTFPKNLVGTQSDIGPIPRNLKPIFRDREELSAGHNLGEKIEAALKASENLIIICSTNAAQSHWVNQEILFFKRHNRGAKIFSVIVDGEPFASNTQEECFPSGLRFDLNEVGELSSTPAEPLAADLRDHGDGKRLGVLKLISGMAGLGVNDLVQRDLQRARKRVTAITASAAAIVLAMGGLTWTAIDARDEADLRRNDAEGQIEFMLTDLKDKLEGVGRLDALQVVGDKAAKYYDQYPISEHDDDALGRRARVFHYLGEIQDKLGNLDEADNYFHQAYDTTQALLARTPQNPDRVYDQAQSAYWAGYVPYRKQNYSQAEKYFLQYIHHAESLKKLEPNSLRGSQELTYAYTNLGIVLNAQRKREQAYEYYSKALPIYIKLAENYPENVSFQIDLANAYAWLSDSYLKVSIPKKSIEYRHLQLKLLKSLLEENKHNNKVLNRLLFGIVGFARLEFIEGNLDQSAEIISKYIQTSKDLWLSDKSNIGWLNNYANFVLVDAEIAAIHLEIRKANQSMDEFLKLREIASSGSKDEPMFFKKLEPRLENLRRKL